MSTTTSTMRTLVLACVAISSFALSACSRDVEQAKREYLERGDRYVKEQNVDAAIIEYRNAIQQDPRFGAAYQRLSRAYLTRGDSADALRAAMTAADLLPGQLDAQLDAGDLVLLSGDFKDAQKRARRALALDGKSTRAHVLLGNATAGLKDVETAVQEFEEALRLDPNQSGIYTGLAVLKANQGEQAEAEKTFRRAIETDPRSVTARLALAQFYWSAERLPEAEQAIREAVAAAPGDSRANVSMAVFYQATRRAAEAEPFLQAAVKGDPTNVRVRLLLADYYIGRQRTTDAAALLQDVKRDRRFGAMASMRLAGIARLEGRTREALAIMDEAITGDPKNASALAFKSDLLREDRRLEDAAQAAEAAVAANAGSADAQFARGRVLAAQGQLAKAETAFKEVLRLNPRTAVARVELARLKLPADGDAALALATEATQVEPQNLDARLTLARALIQKQDYAQAEQVLDGLVRAVPKAAAVHAQMGVLHARKRETAAARAAFGRALELDAVHPEALEGMAALDIAAGRRAEALARLDAAVAARPSEPTLLIVAAKGHAAANDLPRAESLLVKAIEVDPAALPAYSMLGRVYLAQKRLGQARQQFERLASKQENPVAALTVVGMIDLLENKMPAAQASFERVLKLDPRAGVAANNLAWIQSESGGSLDMALQLAQTAVTVLPREPEAHDTLGWVYFKRGTMPEAIAALRRSIELDPKNATAVYHLALALEKSGDSVEARRTMAQYLSLDSASPRSAEIKRRLGGLGT